MVASPPEKDRVSSMPAPLRVAAFTDDPAGGNPAGVVIADRLPSAADMLRVAAEVGFSETAFVAPGDADLLDVRYVSPEREVTFCGHATIATGVVLGESDPDLAQVRLATRAGVVPVDLRRDGGRVTATLTSPPASHRAVQADVLEEALGCFGWGTGELDADLGPVVASAGATHLVLPVATREVLASMAYRYDDLRALMLEQDWTTVAVVWREADDRWHARNPFPVGGVVEDPATGAAAAALGGWLRDAGIVGAPAELAVLQGADMGRPSMIRVGLLADAPGIEVTGTAVPMP